MAPTRHPLIDLVYNDETGRYIAMLERKLLLLTTENIKMRTLLELLTGDMWDDVSFKSEDKELQAIAVDALKRRLQMSETDARKLVSERWAANNPPSDVPPVARTMMAGRPAGSPTPHVVMHSRPVGYQAPYDHEKHLRGIAQAKGRREQETPKAP